MCVCVCFFLRVHLSDTGCYPPEGCVFSALLCVVLMLGECLMPYVILCRNSTSKSAPNCATYCVDLSFVYLRYRLVAHHLELCALTRRQSATATAEPGRRARHVRRLEQTNVAFAALGAYASLGVLLVAAFPVWYCLIVSVLFRPHLLIVVLCRSARYLRSIHWVPPRRSPAEPSIA